MDLNDLRSAVMLLLFIAFVAVAGWAWLRRNEVSFSEAANLPFAEPPALAPTPTAATKVERP